MERPRQRDRDIERGRDMWRYRQTETCGDRIEEKCRGRKRDRQRERERENGGRRARERERDYCTVERPI